MESSRSTLAGVGMFIAAALVFGGGLVIGACNSLDSTGPTEVAVVQNGGPLDAKDQREVVGPSSGWMVPGLFSGWHVYPSADEQRFYTVTTDEGRADSPTATTIAVPTKDGVQVSLEATTFFRTAFTGEDDDPLLREFDLSYGNREFDGKHVWDGSDGWAAFLDAQFRPVLENTVREEIGRFDCAQLVSSCALIQAGQSGEIDFEQVAEAGDSNQSNFDRVQDAIQTKLAERIDATLGGPYLEGIEFRMARITLPGDVQAAIDEAQSSFAAVATERANYEKSKFEAQRLSRLARQYEKSPALAMKETAESLANNSEATIILGGEEFALGAGK
jgi:regulator of protease activity HflC (stomatin/prohibitin superfamily)